MAGTCHHIQGHSQKFFSGGRGGGYGKGEVLPKGILTACKIFQGRRGWDGFQVSLQYHLITLLP